MPSNMTEPAAGGNQVAAAQLLTRFNLIVEENTFAAGVLDSDFRTANQLYIGALPEVFITLLLYPQYDRGDFVFEARNYISWRVVGINPGAEATDFTGVLEDGWAPVTTPQLLPVGEPIHFKLPCGGLENIALEVDTTGGEPAANQGQDRLLITVSASQ